MSKLAEGLSRFFGRVEILARGADDERRAAERALERGHHLEARAHARALLARVPRSPVGLALWADAAEACWLDDEVVQALSLLAAQLPWRQEVWLRLGLAGQRAGWPQARAALERAASGRGDLVVARQALLVLADLDIDAGEIARAQRWLDRIPAHRTSVDAELALRRTECAFASGSDDEARSQAARLEDLDPHSTSVGGRCTLGARRRLVLARLAHRFADEPHGGQPIALALGAYLLDAPGAAELLAELVAGCRDVALIDRARWVTTQLGHVAEARWQAAFALAEGRREDARTALMLAAGDGDEAAARTLLTLATQWRDLDAIHALQTHHPTLLSDGLRALMEAHVAADSGDNAEALDALDRCRGATEAWAQASRRKLLADWVGHDDEPSRWDDIFSELRRAARGLDRGDICARIDSLGIERKRPLFVAVLGEFNAGKSTLINALLGTDVAPTGIRPTTASVHWVAWAPDPFARVLVRGESDRVVAHDELKSTLERLRAAGEQVQRVFIYAPIERLKRIEILDTPGFNAPDTSHADEARRGIEEAHVALWLLDATAPLKESERRVIEHVAAAGVPVQVLVNKRDRLDQEQLDRVMGYLERALHDTDICSLAAPVALSAQLALAGRLGDEEALAASGWPDVERVLEHQIVNRCDALRERALRRKAGAIAAELDEVASQRCRTQAAAREDARRLAEHRASLAARFRAERSDIAVALVDELAETLALLETDARPIEQLPAERREHPQVRAYLVDKTVERLGPAICLALDERARQQHDAALFEASELSRVVRATLAGAAAVHSAGVILRGAALRGAIEQALVIACDLLERASAVAPTEAVRQGQRIAALRLALADYLPNIASMSARSP